METHQDLCWSGLSGILNKKSTNGNLERKYRAKDLTCNIDLADDCDDFQDSTGSLAKRARPESEARRLRRLALLFATWTFARSATGSSVLVLVVGKGSFCNVPNLLLQEISKLSGILVNLLASYQLPSQDVLPFVRDTDKVRLFSELLIGNLFAIFRLPQSCPPFGPDVPQQLWKHWTLCKITFVTSYGLILLFHHRYVLISHTGETEPCKCLASVIEKMPQQQVIQVRNVLFRYSESPMESKTS